MRATCGVCGNEGKYKCSTCKKYYCSMECMKKHRDSCSATPAPKRKLATDFSRSLEERIDPNFVLEDTLNLPTMTPSLQLQLDNSQEIAELLRDEHTRAVAMEIVHLARPSAANVLDDRQAVRRAEIALDQARDDKAFDRLVTTILKVVKGDGM
ncbi:BRCA1 C Terminus (BRCT) domain [Carpediemonas membranifera]|uniref:BRCA1 C Terminus (BRCT) domain n=1 Tax=Carpediemonas membranifera TaxID=201153 RepID=A0A8J6E8C7_9EUKA|nr:BRCA1 C Terminus (BRCT) domain [Carpediemonas membranifera]|eukprot:KAG9391720.1 BRCA1 C Terminus (BRCT) domain [Carpediemonas membranifera]